MARGPVSEGPSLDPPAGAGAVVLLVEHARNREVLADLLAPTVSVRTDLPESAADVGTIVVDEPGLASHGEAIESHVAASEPVVLPVLLVARDVDRLPERVWSLADEVVGTPIARQVFANRLAVLLRSRAQALAIERQRERSEQRFRRLFSAAPDPVLLVDGDGTILDANAAFVDVVDRPRASLVGTRVDAVGFEPASRVEDLLLAPDQASGDPSDRVVTYDRAGESLVAELNAALLTDTDAGRECVGIFRDVTDREASRRALEGKIDRLDEFTGIVSHDLRNPLTVAKGQLSLAREDCEETESLDAVAESLDRMGELIDRLLEVARTGNGAVDAEPVDLGAVARDAAALLESASVTVTVDADATILADESRLQRIFENLFRNAVEHGSTSPHSETRGDAVEHGSTSPHSQTRGDAVEHGSTSPHSQAHEEAEPQVAIRVGLVDDGFYVEDDGPGIPADEREAVLEAGYTTEESGSGLGLSIVGDGAAAHGWCLSIEEGAAGGARFVFRGVERP